MLCPFIGILSDRAGRRPVMLGASVACLVFTYPAFALLSLKTDAAIIAGFTIFGVLTTILAAPLPAVLAEAFPTRLRYSGLSIGYSVAASLTGLASPFALTWLIDGTGDQIGPSLWVFLAGLIGLVAVIRLRETGHRALS